MPEGLEALLEVFRQTQVKLPPGLRSEASSNILEQWLKKTFSLAAEELFAAEVCAQVEGSLFHDRKRCDFNELRILRGQLQSNPRGSVNVNLDVLNEAGSEALFKLFGPLLTQYAYAGNHESLAKSVELIPAKTYLNVNDIQSAVRAKNLIFYLKTILGFGLKLDYQSQREHFETFMSQDVYGAAMGKGTDTFGWVFGPEPGRKHINPGTRTTYAVLWVPSDARAIQIDREFCFFKNNSQLTDSNCKQVPNSEAYLAIPHANEGFFLHSMSYAPTKVGGTAMVYLYGQDFSPQLGVVVDGQPLARALSITDPTLAAEHKLPAPLPPAAGVKYWGEYEVVNSQTVVVKITSGIDAPPGVPEIALVAPGKALSLNRLPTTINGIRRAELETVAGATGPQKMFRSTFHLVAAKFAERKGGKIKAILVGGPFDKSDEIKVNGTRVPATAIQEISKTSRQIEFTRPAAYNWIISATHFGAEEITESATILDPLPPERTSITQQRVPGVEGKPDTLLVTINGASMYALRTPTVKGGDSVAAFPKTVKAEFNVGTDGKSIVLTIEDPPPFLELSFKPLEGDADGAGSWPHSFAVTPKPKVSDADKAKAATAAKLLQLAKDAMHRTLLAEQVALEAKTNEELALAAAKAATEEVSKKSVELATEQAAAAKVTDAKKKIIAAKLVSLRQSALNTAKQVESQKTLLAGHSTQRRILAEASAKAAKAAEEVAVTRSKNAATEK